MRQAVALLGLCGALMLAVPVWAAGEDEVGAVFDRFVTAQNAHDLTTVRDVLLDSPGFLWITRGAAIWGKEAALARFDLLYKGTWHLEPVSGDLKVMMLADGTAQLYVPIVFTIGPASQSALASRFLMNQTLVKTATGWKIASILPIPAPAP